MSIRKEYNQLTKDIKSLLRASELVSDGIGKEAICNKINKIYEKLEGIRSIHDSTKCKMEIAHRLYDAAYMLFYNVGGSVEKELVESLRIKYYEAKHEWDVL